MKLFCIRVSPPSNESPYKGQKRVALTHKPTKSYPPFTVRDSGSERCRAFLAAHSTSLQSSDQGPRQLTPELCRQGRGPKDPRGGAGLAKHPGQVSRALGRAKPLGLGGLPW